jgi:signal transduction histidine kinase
VELDLSPDLPAVRADRIQLQQVANNLIVNAIDAMMAQTGRRKILSVSAEAADGEWVAVSIADNGVGLQSDVIDRVFDHLVTTKVDGMGLGLAISKSIIEAHGGRITAAPNAPHGAVFRFLLPSRSSVDA